MRCRLCTKEYCKECVNFYEAYDSELRAYVFRCECDHEADEMTEDEVDEFGCPDKEDYDEYYERCHAMNEDRAYDEWRDAQLEAGL